MYLDTDIILSGLKEDDWLKDVVNFEMLEAPKTSMITALEIQLIYFENRDREFIATVPAKIGEIDHIDPREL